MNFRFVLLGPEDDPNHSVSQSEDAAKQLSLSSRRVRYERSGPGMVRIERLENGRTRVTALANFHARIVGDLIVDEGHQERREFRLEAEVAGQSLSFSLTAEEFAGMGWVLKRLGPQAILYPGQQQQARAAIQWLSGQIRQERIFAHLGWRKHGPAWVYLHAGGALGKDGAVPAVQVHLPAALQPYHPSAFAPGRRASECGASQSAIPVGGAGQDHLPPAGGGLSSPAGEGGFQSLSHRKTGARLERH